MAKTVLIVGASGIIGRAHIRNLAGSDTRILAAARRPDADLPENAAPYPVDLLSGPEDLGPLEDVTHALYAAYIDAPFDKVAAPNIALMEGALRVFDHCPNLTHVALIQGTKAYGSHLGAFKTPAKESDPRIPGGHFYDDQADLLSAWAERRGCGWTALRPHAVIGPALRSPMNLMAVIGAYGTICAATGRPFAFPGPEAAFKPLYQTTDSDLLSRAIEWSGEAETARGEVFNITNGDYFRWGTVWPALAAFFGLEAEGPADFKLAETMPEHGPLWAELAAKHELIEPDLSRLAGWPFGDYVFNTTWDIMSDGAKIRQAGFWEYVDSEALLISRLEELQALKVIP